MLSNEKYAGNVILLGNGLHSECYLSKENNQAIISEETFKAVQLEKGRRSNLSRKMEFRGKVLSIVRKPINKIT